MCNLSWLSSTGYQWSSGSSTRWAHWRTVSLTAPSHPTYQTNSPTTQTHAHSGLHLNSFSIHHGQDSKRQVIGHSDLRLPTPGIQSPLKFVSHPLSTHSNQTWRHTSLGQPSINSHTRQIAVTPGCPASVYCVNMFVCACVSVCVRECVCQCVCVCVCDQQEYSCVYIHRWISQTDLCTYTNLNIDGHTLIYPSLYL